MVQSDNLTLLNHVEYDRLRAAYQGFLLAREAERCTPRTIEHYVYTVGSFVEFLRGLRIDDPRDIAPEHIRRYLLVLEKRELKDTTQHAHARGIKTWLKWLVREGDLDQNPMRNVGMPRLEQRIPPPYSKEDIETLLAGCNRRDPRGTRNYAIVLGLLDTGLRLAEFASLKRNSVNMRTGLATVMGKGRKQRQVRFGAKARGALARWLAARDALVDEYDDSLWGIGAQGIQVMLHRLGKLTGVRPCGAHRFRRTFALWCLRGGMDLHSLRALMGHADLTVLLYYLKLEGEDVERAHRAHSPADTML